MGEGMSSGESARVKTIAVTATLSGQEILATPIPCIAGIIKINEEKFLILSKKVIPKNSTDNDLTTRSSTFVATRFSNPGCGKKK